jgi:hypothetical protein
MFFRLPNGRLEEVKGIVRPLFPGSMFSVSPDGKSLLFTQVGESSSDLMLVQNFR